MANSEDGSAAAPRGQGDARQVPEPAALAYVEKVRLATRRLSAAEPGAPDEVRLAIDAVRTTRFDAEVPTASTRRELELVKVGVKRLSGWYVRYLTAQLDLFGASLVRLGEALAARSDALQAGHDDLSVRVGALEERLRRLEAAAAATKIDRPAD
jgi:hypothetical protein